MNFIYQYAIVFISGVSIGIIGTLVMQILPEARGFDKNVITPEHRKFFNV